MLHNCNDCMILIKFNLYFWLNFNICLEFLAYPERVFLNFFQNAKHRLRFSYEDDFDAVAAKIDI